MREIILDTETTGLDPNSGHRIIEIGALEVYNKIKTGKFFHVYLNPERNVPDEAFKIHGISTEFLKDKKKFVEIADEFLDFIGGDQLVIHNARFDLKFLNYELAQVNRPLLDHLKVVDTLELARRKFPGSPASLNALCKRFEIDLSARDKHGALLDSELLADVYLWLCGGHQPEMLSEAEIEEITGNELTKLSGITRKYREKRTFDLNDQDWQAHLEFLKKIKNLKWETS